ncbi:MAG TPA: VOC family protein [Candidatus Saccharimonadales bacterium]|jgi:catechol 2,3-dioxygenase-like lactoylglutathione lyase family enzyme|nr:VOC family protein [Candidatus Saccharimonadales bacterium]
MDLSNANIAANVAVFDLKRALKFYEEKLGLKTMAFTDFFGAAMSTDGSTISLAQREKTPSDEDSVNFTVKDIKATIKELESRGVIFQNYDTDRLKTIDHISEYKGFQAAWFKDSEDNTLQINQSPSQ